MLLLRSAGNHAQGVALSGQKLGIRSDYQLCLVKPRQILKLQAGKNLGGRGGITW